MKSEIKIEQLFIISTRELSHSYRSWENKAIDTEGNKDIQLLCLSLF